MARFSIRLLWFVLPLIVAVFFIPLVDFAVLKFNFKKSSSVLVMGDSHTETAIDDTIDRTFKNVSQSSETYLFTYHKLKRILKVNKPETIVLGFSPHNVTFFHDEKNFAINGNTRYLELYPRYFYTLDLPGISYLQEYSSSGVINILPQIVKENIVSLLRFKNNYIGAFRNSEKSNLDSNLVNEKIKTHFYFDTERIHDISSVQLEYLEKIIIVCQKEGINVVLINLPVHNTYLTKIPDSIIKKYNELLADFESRNVRVLDYSEFTFPDEYYGDGDHLNSLGAKEITGKLISDLN